MGWLSDRMIKHIYEKPDGETIILELHVQEDAPETYEGGVRKGFIPEDLGGYIRIQFERNGRIGYEYRQSGGKRRTVSATRERWEHNVGNMGRKAYKDAGSKVNETVYTKAVGKAAEKIKIQKAKNFVKGLEAAKRKDRK